MESNEDPKPAKAEREDGLYSVPKKFVIVYIPPETLLEQDRDKVRSGPKFLG